MIKRIILEYVMCTLLNAAGVATAYYYHSKLNGFLFLGIGLNCLGYSIFTRLRMMDRENKNE